MMNDHTNNRLDLLYNSWKT